MNTWPLLELMPNQPDERLKTYCYNTAPSSHLAAIEVALSLATSCLTTCMTPYESSGSSPAETRKYAGEVIDNITYLRLANFVDQ